MLRASDFGVYATKDDKLLALVQAVGGDAYLSGPAAKAYLRPDLWRSAAVALLFKNYDGYPEYEQIAHPYEPSVSILDLLFMKGFLVDAYVWDRTKSQ